MSDYLDPNNEELLKDFFAEAEQQVETLESNILIIESDPSNREAVDEIFRAAHTLKGGSATVEMTELAGFTHKVEDVLDEIRSDHIEITEPVIDILLTSIDVIKAMLEHRSNGSVYEENIDELVASLQSYIPGKGDKVKSTPKEKVAPVVAPVVSTPVAPVTENSMFEIQPLSEDEFAELKGACDENQKLWCVSVKFDENNPMNSVGGIQVFAALKALGSVLKTVPDFDALYEDAFYENVYYYIATSESQEKIEDVAFLGDVTVCTDARQVLSAEVGTKNNATIEKVAEPIVESVKETPVVAPVAAPVEDKSVEAVQTESSGTEQPKVVQKTEVKKSEQKKDTAQHNAQQGSVLRVDSRRVDYLMNLVSETVITKAAFNQIAMHLSDELTHFQSVKAIYSDKVRKLFDQIPHYFEDLQNGANIKDVKNQISQEFSDLSSLYDEDDAELKNMTIKLRSAAQNLGRIAGELQEGVMKIRMVPINQIFSRFPRVVRDLQRDLNKKVNLVIEGEDTELDKSVVEDLLDPIMHCVRNSVDHGVESPEERIKSGKSEVGTVLLKASNEGNLIVIDIADDGAGIDPEKVKQKAISKGLIHPDKVLTDQEAYQLIFMPGFSTAEKITNVSGRGVGLDVVKTMIDKLNGTVSVSSEKGKGTTFSIKLPLTLAIIQGLLVRVGKEIYSIPIASVIESQRIKPEEINTIDNYEVLNVRNEVISVLRLARLFNIRESVQDEYCNIVIVGSKDKKVGIMVDSLIGEEDVVIKPLRDQFTNSPGIAGASILGDGSVSLIIDVGQLLELSVKQEMSSQRNLD